MSHNVEIFWKWWKSIRMLFICDSSRKFLKYHIWCPWNPRFLKKIAYLGSLKHLVLMGPQNNLFRKKIHQSKSRDTWSCRLDFFYRTQVSLGSSLWVPASVCHSESLVTWSGKIIGKRGIPEKSIQSVAQLRWNYLRRTLQSKVMAENRVLGNRPLYFTL